MHEAGPAYRDRFGPSMLPSHRRAMCDIESCRTPAMGGHVKMCDKCSKLEYRYHSCTNRHCPKCHGNETRRWLATQSARLPHCEYYFVTFTLPAELRQLARSHQKQVYSILMRCAAEALLKLTADPKFLGATPGILGVLHTWTRALLYHPHVHFLVTAGGLTNDGERWLAPKNPRFLVPGYALSPIVRAKVRDALKAAGLLSLAPKAVWAKDWVVQCQRAGGGREVLVYLSRYVHRVALQNESIEHFENDKVTFRYRDSKTKEIHRCTLPSGEFLARFLQHVLPRGFTKVRYYGVLSSTSKAKLEKVNAILDGRAGREKADNPTGSTNKDKHDKHEHDDDERCASCGVGLMRVVATLPRRRGPP